MGGGGAGYDISASLSAASSFATINFGTESLAGATFDPNNTATSAATTSKGNGSPAQTNLDASPSIGGAASAGGVGAVASVFSSPLLLLGIAAAAIFFLFKK
jgi:hypothetical protein